jgi:hypothetical protein
VIAQAPQLPALSFLGFRAGMPVAQARALIRAAGGSLECRMTSDPRMHECNGFLPILQQAARETVSVLVSSVRDSAAVIVVSRHRGADEPTGLVATLTADFGTPNRQVGPGAQASWEWIRRGQKLVVAQRREENRLASSVTLTDGPLLDGLGSPKLKGPTRPLRSGMLGAG